MSRKKVIHLTQAVPGPPHILAGLPQKPGRFRVRAITTWAS